MMKAYERLLRYVCVPTASSETSGTVPTTQCQFNLAHMLVDEMKKMGIEDAHVDDKCYVYGKGKLADNYVAGRNDGNLIIEFEGDESLIGTFQNIKVIEPLTFVMRGELVKEKQI